MMSYDEWKCEDEIEVIELLEEKFCEEDEEECPLLKEGFSKELFKYGVKLIQEVKDDSFIMYRK